jgi:Lsr2
MKEVIVRVVDDLDRVSDVALAGGRTVSLAFDGKQVELDLIPEHIDVLAAFLAPYFKAAEPQPSTLQESRRHNAEMRAWGKDHGWPDLKPGGNIPKALRAAHAAYLEAHQA